MLNRKAKTKIKKSAFLGLPSFSPVFFSLLASLLLASSAILHNFLCHLINNAAYFIISVFRVIIVSFVKNQRQQKTFELPEKNKVLMTDFFFLFFPPVTAVAPFLHLWKGSCFHNWILSPSSPEHLVLSQTSAYSQFYAVRCFRQINTRHSISSVQFPLFTIFLWKA